MGRVLLHSLLYCDQHKLQISQDFAIRNAENADTVLAHPLASHHVTRRIDVGDAVEFNHQLCSSAAEISNVPTQWHLSAEF
jgi:hypothetical protein